MADGTADPQHGQIAQSAAEIYDEFFVPALFAQWPEQILDRAGAGLGHHVLDVGCGTGVLARAALERVGPDGSVVGVDLNPAMLEVARRHGPAVEWQLADALALPFEDRSFDRVVSQFALMFLDDRAAGIGEMARVLVPSGRLAVATWASIDRSPGYAAMVKLLERLFGVDVADALRAPFALGEADDLRALLAPTFADAEILEIVELHGEATFASIEAWVHTDIRGWTLADRIDDEDYQRLLTVAVDELGRFTDDSGRVRFAAPALIAVASAPSSAS